MLNRNIQRWIAAGQIFEGWYPGSKSWINNNPGNLKFVGQQFARKDPTGFCIFPTYQIGYQAMYNMIMNACTGKSQVYKPEMTILQFYQKYTSDGPTVSANYAAFVASMIGCKVDTIIKTLIL